MEFARLEREVRVLKIYAAISTVVSLSVLFATSTTAQNQRQKFSEIDVEQINVLDAKGVVRARIGGQLPDSVVDGKVRPRGDRAAGVLLYDARGQERGGYVTFDESDNVALTLDTRQGQTALFAAGPEGGSRLQMWQADNRIDLIAMSTGARVTTVRAGQVSAQIPQMLPVETTNLCSEIKLEVAQLKAPLSPPQLLAACAKLMPETNCRACLGIQ